mgnify:CR=1 FL=1
MGADNLTEPRTLTKSDIVDSIHRKVGMSKKDASSLIERVFETIKQTLSRGPGRFVPEN